MGLAVVTVAAGGLPVVESTAGGTPVTEAANGRGIPVTKVVGKPGLPVVFETIGVGPGVTYATWDVTTAVQVTLSGGDLVVTNTGTTTNHGIRAATSTGKAGGKYYWEATATTILGGSSRGIGIGTAASTYVAMGNNAIVGAMAYFFAGNIFTNGTNTGITIGSSVNGNVTCGAFDLDNRKAWFRRTPSGQWNASGTADPATNVGGVTIPAGTMVPFMTFGGGAGVINNVITTNFGASAFAGAVPAGFTSGWPA